MMVNILSGVKKDSLLKLLSKGKRFSDRKLDDYREISVQKDVLPTGEGSALVQLGKTQVLAIVKVGVLSPFSDRPTEGVIMSNAEFVAFANDEFEPGPPNEESIELARVVDRGIRNSDIIDMKDFFIEEGKVKGLFIDLWILDHDGNLTDCSALAAMVALKSAKMPGIMKTKEGGLTLDYDNPKGTVPMKGIITTCTFSKVGNHILLDASLDEELAEDGRLMISVSGDKIVATQKSKSGSFTTEEVSKCVDIAFKKASKLKKYIN